MLLFNVFCCVFMVFHPSCFFVFVFHHMVKTGFLLVFSYSFFLWGCELLPHLIGRFFIMVFHKKTSHHYHERNNSGKIFFLIFHGFLFRVFTQSTNFLCFCGNSNDGVLRCPFALIPLFPEGYGNWLRNPHLFHPLFTVPGGRSFFSSIIRFPPHLKFE